MQLINGGASPFRTSNLESAHHNRPRSRYPLRGICPTILRRPTLWIPKFHLYLVYSKRMRVGVGAAGRKKASRRGRSTAGSRSLLGALRLGRRGRRTRERARVVSSSPTTTMTRRACGGRKRRRGFAREEAPHALFLSLALGSRGAARPNQGGLYMIRRTPPPSVNYLAYQQLVLSPIPVLQSPVC